MEKKNIPYTKHEITEDDIKSVADALRSDWIATGPKTKEFEEIFSKMIGCRHSIAVSSATAALDLSLKVLELPNGSEIITTPFTFVATSNAMIYNNLKPVFCDIDKETFNINPKLIEEKITDRTRAVFSVDYAGQPCEYDKITKICDENGLILLEDAAHAVGAEVNGKKVGTIAKMTSFSFHATKNLTTGEGGIITTDDEEIAKKLHMLRSHGIDSDPLNRSKDATWRYDMKMLGMNYRMTDFQCALGISQLQRTNKIIQRRTEIVDFYNKEFSNIKGIRTPILKKNVKSSWHLYTILLDDVNRDEMYRHLLEKGIIANVHYIPVYKHSYYKEKFRIDESEFPVTEDVFKRILTLPLFQKMTDDDAKRVVAAVKEGIEKLK